jgi:hypothetical protein
MLVMPLCFARLGVKWMLVVGMAAWVARYGLFSVAADDKVTWMILLGIILHGICYDFFFVTGQIYTDQMAPPKLRAQAQGLLVVFTLGLGMLIGAKTAGWVESIHTTDESKAVRADVERLARELRDLEAEGASKSEVDAKRDEVKAQRIKELKAIDWKPLWMKPAIFAAVVMSIFLLFFHNPSGNPGAASM